MLRLVVYNKIYVLYFCGSVKKEDENCRHKKIFIKQFYFITAISG